jgi:two-component system sensor histidine kinase RegB
MGAMLRDQDSYATPPGGLPVSPPRAITPDMLPAGRVSQRTLVIIRWFAVFGQLVAVLTVHFAMEAQLPLASALCVIGALAVLNIGASLDRPGRRLSEAHVAGYLAFDILQLSILLYLTGGLDNPFAIMFLAPVTVAATVLSRNMVLALTVFTIAVASVVALVHEPLPWSTSVAGGLPRLYTAGNWIALVIACTFIVAYNWQVVAEERRMTNALAATQVALGREQRLSALGALAAAAAHELGTPLSTIAVAAKELKREVPPGGMIAEDIDLILKQTERCRIILADLSRKPQPVSGDDPFEQMRPQELLDALAMNYQSTGKHFTIETIAEDDSEAPLLRRTPEMVHGLSNILNNALQFALHDVVAEVTWSESEVSITISDDGPGFPDSVLDRLGEPYISTRVGQGDHLGLGIFIAKTLLEQTGADLSFGNADEGGAIVRAVWPRPNPRTPTQKEAVHDRQNSSVIA